MNGIGDKDGGVVEPEPTTGSVKFASTLPHGLKDGQFGVVTGNVSVRPDGRAVADIELTAPEWAYTADGAMTVTYGSGGHCAYVYVDYQILRKGDDTAWGTGSIEGWNATANHGGVYLSGDKEGKYSISGLNLNGIISAEHAKDQELTLEITNVRWRFVKVEKYVDEVEAPLASGEKKCLSIFENENAISFPIEISGTGTADYTITGVNGLAKPTGTLTAGSGYQTAGSGADKKISAEGNKAIVITVTSNEDLVKKYTVSGAGKLDSTKGGIDIAGHFGVPSASISGTEETAKLQIVTREVQEGETAAVSIKLSSAAQDKGVYKYIATLNVNGVKITEELKDSGGRLFEIPNVTSDIEITEDMITIERVEVPHVVSAEVKGGTSLVLTFNIPVAFADGAVLGGNDSSKVQHSLSKDGLTLTFTVTEAGLTWGAGPDDDDTIGIGAAKVHAVDDENNTNKTIVVTVKAGTAKTEIDNRWS